MAVSLHEYNHADYDELLILRAENEKLRDAIKTHRSQKADDRCIEDDDRLYEALGDGIKCDRRVGSKFEMARNCFRFIDVRCEEGGSWKTYAELEKENSELKNEIEMLKGLLQNGAKLVESQPSPCPAACELGNCSLDKNHPGKHEWAVKN